MLKVTTFPVLMGTESPRDLVKMRILIWQVWGGV